MDKWLWCKNCKKKTKHILLEFLFCDAGVCNQCDKVKEVGDWYDD